MKVGDRVVLVKEIDMWERVYEVGHQFTIVSEDDLRGFNLKDDDGNIVGETRFISDHYVLLSEMREGKINKILK